MDGPNDSVPSLMGLTKDQFRDRVLGIVDACSDVLGRSNKPIKPHGIAHVFIQNAEGNASVKTLLADLSGRSCPSDMISGMDYLGRCAKKSGGVLQSSFFVHQCDVIVADSPSPEDLVIEKLIKHPSRRKCLFISGVLAIYSEGEPIEVDDLDRDTKAKLDRLSAMPLTPLSVTAAFPIDKIASVSLVNRKPMLFCFQDGIPQGFGLPKSVLYAFSGVSTKGIIASEGGESMFPSGNSSEGAKQAFPFYLPQSDDWEDGNDLD